MSHTLSARKYCYKKAFNNRPSLVRFFERFQLSGSRPVFACRGIHANARITIFGDSVLLENSSSMFRLSPFLPLRSAAAGQLRERNARRCIDEQLNRTFSVDDR
ncbi:hypothetical protein TNCV_1688201 [Trichonephila clavipes]|nr:hypothetical protein TNCV_1688201 [Trichonephila clavipes]